MKSSSRRPRPPERRLRGWLAILRNLALFFAALVAATVVVELFPALKALESWMEDNEDSLLWVTLPVCFAGVFLLVGRMVWHLARHPDGKPLVFQIGELKRSAAERRRFPWLAALGGALVFAGVFGTCIVFAPMALKLILAALALYAIARIAWAVYRA